MHQRHTSVGGLEGNLGAEELNDELAVVAGVVDKGSLGSRQELAVGRLETILALREEHKRDRGILAPGDDLIRVQHTLAQVDIRLAVHVADAHPATTVTTHTQAENHHILRVHGELDDPQAVASNDLGVGIDVLGIASGIVAVGSLEGPASVSLSLDLEGLVGSLARGAASELAVGSSRQVSVVGAAVASVERQRAQP
jgi:hypothetical protein